eukprot:TRINITY_DN9608_c0_g1_i1.p1 TRINITY_DN9608_c0_g1~~TRINITY_DN9608_c0_g1_i1.p1  ORF type:complete len:215 (-),score=28.17 TRINITY_DN9608_c0_g1_i1:127-771(-)
MEDKLFGKFALVTGGGSGIGRALSIALAKRGVCITIVDYNEVAGKEAVLLVEEEHAKLSTSLGTPGAIFVKCDVSIPADLASSFLKHLGTYGRLDICINSAGVPGTAGFGGDKSHDGSGEWRRIINVNLTALIDSTRLAINAMEAKNGGTILNIGSMAGIVGAPPIPVYGASKGGVVLFSKSLSSYRHKGIRVNVLCPGVEFHSCAKLLVNIQY